MKSFLAATCLLTFALAAPAERRSLIPTVKLDYATVVGSSLLGVDSFKGIPYAQPPLGQLRLKPPQPITGNLGTVAAVGTPKACPQYLTGFNSSSLPLDVITTLLNSPLLQLATDSGEDCLTVNVQRPATANASSKLPVVFWMFGGGFQFGSTQTYDASELISTSMAKNQDIVYVSVNYRTGAFGWLAGDEMKKDGSTNIGLLDQRAGLEWVADNIEKFGGDSSKVTIWGESAGSISVLDQMVAYNGDNTYKGKPLFRAGIMDSGSVVPADPVDGVKGNDIYRTVVRVAGCEGSSDTLNCLRGVDYETFLKASTSVPGILDYSSVALSYVPRPDGVILTDSPDVLVQKGLIAKVPFIVGDQEDEGTLFALTQSNVTTTALLVTYLKNIFFYDATVTQIEKLVSLYPDNAAAGSPFGTGSLNEIYPQFKRLAAILGDLTFTITRRVFLTIAASVNPSVPSWSYLASYGYGTPILGTFHATDILPTYGIVPSFQSTTIQSYYISFINYLDPNKGANGQIHWPEWSESKQLINFRAANNTLISDDFRNAVYEYLIGPDVRDAFHI